MQIAFFGDVMLGRLVNDVLRTREPAYVWGDTLSILRTADVRICNLECAFADHAMPWYAYEKTFYFGSDAKNVAALTCAGIDAVSLANNHALDYGYMGLAETLAVLDNVGIYHSGAGFDDQEAQEPVIIVKDGACIGMLAVTDNEPEWAAGARKAGVWHVPMDINSPAMAALIHRVQELRATVSIVIISLHWGPNWGIEPPLSHQDVAHALIDAGASIIFGHSPHIFRGIEWYRSCPIIYSAGDFIDDYEIDEVERNDWSFIFMLKRVDDRYTLRLYPTVIEKFQARLATREEAARIGGRMIERCASLGTRMHWRSDILALDCEPS